jgi:uncharacterized protein (DUF433 family)
MDWTGCKWVESVPERLGGAPVLVNTRMQADGVLENFDAGLSVEEICYHFFLDVDTVRGVLGFAGCLQMSDAA